MGEKFAAFGEGRVVLQVAVVRLLNSILDTRLLVRLTQTGRAARAIR